MNIGVDIDNVLSNFNEALYKEFLMEDQKKRNRGIVNPDLYMTKGMFDWSKEEITLFYKDNIQRIAMNLDVIEGAKEAITKLRKDGNQIYIITGRDNGEYSDPYTMTETWLKKHKIEYDKLILTNAYDSSAKAMVCQENNIAIMIDDSSRILKEVEKIGVKTLLMHTFYNRKETHFTRVFDWNEIYQFIINYNKEKRNVIFDTDTYNECDDQFALAYLLKSQDVFQIDAITVAPYSHKKYHETVISGQEKSYQEILKICKWLNFDYTDKVFKGATDYIQNGYQDSNEAVEKIIQIVLANDKTYIMAIGALTNVALAILKEPNIIDKMEVIWLGGHSFLQQNNLDFNFRQDIDAVRIVFDSKVKLTVIPCKNVASNLVTSIYELNHYLKGKSPLCDYLIERFHDDSYHELKERRVIWDIAVVAYLINQQWFMTTQISCPNIQKDSSYEFTKDRHQITIVNNVNSDFIYKDLFEKLGKVEF